MLPAERRALRKREGASQAVFARYLNVTTGLISQWERGEKHPKGASAQAPVTCRQARPRDSSLTSDFENFTLEHREITNLFSSVRQHSATPVVQVRREIDKVA